MGISSESTGFSLGPFHFTHVVGKAGMGVVWQGVHQEQGVPVAIKVLTQEGSRDPLYLTCLRNEVRGVAALDHPGIIHVYDYGVLPDSVKDVPDDDLVAGSPYLVMELAEGGILSPYCGKLDWQQVSRVLLRLLDGLAHAHARGVVHRDIKPSNVLLRRKSGGVILTDFGLARAGDTEGGAFLNAGTPAYMAPEQIRASGRDIGPWTDLYALGCLAHTLLCGKPPYNQGSLQDIMEAHLDEPIPDLVANTEVPTEVHGWLRALLSKGPGQRFTRAADAAHALMLILGNDGSMESDMLEAVFSPEESMPGDKSNEPLSSIVGDVSFLENKTSDTLIMEQPLGDSQGGRPGPMPTVASPILVSGEHETPPIPEKWERVNPLGRRAHLLGTGLGIFGLRNLPVIGRQEAQEHLWQSLHSVVDSGRTQAVVIEGSDGVGKTHLAEWIARRAHEVGAMTVLRVRVRATGEEGDELLPLVHGLLGTAGLSKDATRERVTKSLETLGSSDEAEIDSLVSVLGPFDGDTGHPGHGPEFFSVRHTIIRRLLHRFSAIRPIMVILDEVHWSSDVLGFANSLLSITATEHPILLVLTACSWSAERDAQVEFDQLITHDDVSRLELGSLEDEHRAVLVRELLGLAPSLASLVERRSGGNPQFAIQLVGDWVQKGMLEAGELGFEMRKGVSPDFPADLQAVWERRLAAALPVDSDTRCLQMAAAIGLDIDPRWWRDACAEMDIALDWSLVEALESAHLVSIKHGRRSWRFAHTLVAEALRRQAGFAGILEDLNQAVAQMLLRRGEPGQTPKLGRHLMRAGELEAAIPVLLDGADVCWRTCKYDRGWYLLEQREQALSRLRVPRSDLRWHEGWLMQARFHKHRDDFETAMSLYKRVLKRAENDEANEQMVGEALLGVGGIYRLRSEQEKSRNYLKRAKVLKNLSSKTRSRVFTELAILELAYGNLTLASEYFQNALNEAEVSGDMDAIHKTKSDLSQVCRRQGDMQGARAHIEAVVHYYEQTGQRRRLSGCLNDLAEVDRINGDLDVAEEGYRRALAILESLGDQQFYVARLNLGIIYAESGRTVIAREQLETCVEALKRTGLVGIEGVARLVLAHVEAQEGNLDKWDEQFGLGSQLIRETGFVDVDVARTAQKGGEYLLHTGDVRRARSSLSLARDHWDLLEWTEAAAEITDLLNELEA